ncbi:dephospho-CoA kinase [Mobilisporobacter senegalensis]|uniref:Dephospho-CoA kinase n=1 Tax=Mobilisporobacter senegalensis TaxID=1329262 RepID=A0A3N1XRR5_9FIRM|nr:dephospho-CoA kinase [Mobilisporobacter senegalensis]ROR29359.1 dephospho-CoA kinase [Mobilisporobacter senegalensis]
MALKIIGITGQVGSGKSTVADIMKDKYGAHLILTDVIAHELMKKGAVCYQLIVNYFGKGIVDEVGEIDRSKLSQIVFHDSEKLADLNDMVHPYVMNYAFDEIRRLTKENKVDYVVIETALLIEAGYKEICDEVWAVTVSSKVRKERLSRSRGYSDEKIESILKNQLKDEIIRENATGIINNNGTIDEIIKQIELLLVK